MTDFQSAMKLIYGRIPLVPIYCDAKSAKWFGKWHFNTSTEWVKSLGGPWNTQDDAVSAALATGNYCLRAGTKTPHLDSIASA